MQPGQEVANQHWTGPIEMCTCFSLRKGGFLQVLGGGPGGGSDQGLIRAVWGLYINMTNELLRTPDPLSEPRPCSLSEKPFSLSPPLSLQLLAFGVPAGQGLLGDWLGEE